MAINIPDQKQHSQADWTPHLIKRLRGKRTQAEFATLLGTSKNTVWRWEASHAHPAPYYVKRLSELAERECFLSDWQLVGSIILVDDLEDAKADLDKLFQTSIEHTSRQLVT